LFKYAIKTEITRKYYERRLKKFFDFIEFEIETNKDIEYRCNKFAEKARDNINWALSQIIRFLQYQKERVEKKEITSGTLKNFVKSLKVFCEMADISIPWKKITRGLLNARQSANDRAPTIEEIKKLLEYPDRRIKPIVYTMVSSGIRLGAWDYLKWKHIVPIKDDKGEVLAAKIIVYAGEYEEYYSLITSEAYDSLLDWIKFREEYGEKVRFIVALFFIYRNCEDKKNRKIVLLIYFYHKSTEIYYRDSTIIFIDDIHSVIYWIIGYTSW
jgi:hypothetical protein